MVFGYVEVHPVNGLSKRRFVKPKCFPLKLVAPFICTDIYEPGCGYRKYREFNLSHISWTIIIVLIATVLLTLFVEFFIQAGIAAVYHF